MPIPVSLLQGIGQAALPIITGGVSSVFEMGSSIASQVWEWWSKGKKEKERRAEWQALAEATAAEVRSAVREVVAELAGNQPRAEQFRLESYLLAVPAQVHRTLRRPSDLAGRTVPADLAMARMEDLVPLLPPRPPRYAAGDRVGDLELIELLGIGGFGEVWKARNVFMPAAAPVALKFCIDAQAATSLRQETTLLNQIQQEGKHSGIVQLLDTALTADPPFLKYELVEGGDLGGLIVELHRQKGGPSSVEAARLIQRLAEIVGFAHSRGIIHRDLKPANILIQMDDEADASPQRKKDEFTPRLKVADFGIGAITADVAARAARLNGAMSTRTAAAAQGGYSLFYASPEQIRGTADADPRDDVHAIGVIWYQLLVGSLTAEAPRSDDLSDLAANGMSAELVDLLGKCTASKRERRPGSAAEVAERIGKILSEGSSDEEDYRQDALAIDEQRSRGSQLPLAEPLPQPVLPLDKLDQVRDAIESEKRQRAEQERRRVEEKRQAKFLAGLRDILDAMRKLSGMRMGRISGVLLLVLAIALSALEGIAIAWSTEFPVEFFNIGGKTFRTNKANGIATGVLTFVFLWICRNWLRRRRLRNLNKRVDETVATLRVEYPVEMAIFGQIDFHDPEVLEKVISEVDRRFAVQYVSVH